MNPRRLALVVGCLLLAGVLGVLLLTDPRAPGDRRPTAVAREAPDPTLAVDAQVLRAIEVLRAWDGRRADAWAAGDPSALTPLYVPGSRTGRADRAMLRAYAERGLRVTGLRMQLLSVDVLSADRGALRLLVTDRLASAVADGHRQDLLLPRDQPSTRLVSLRRWAGSWRVVAVLDRPPVPGQRSAVASTPDASRSSKR